MGKPADDTIAKIEETKEQEHHEEVCDFCGEVHRETQDDHAHAGPQGSGSLLDLLSILRADQPPPKTAKQRADELLEELKNSAREDVGNLVNVASHSMDHVTRVLSILPADDREKVMGILEVWVAKTKSEMPGMRQEDIEKGRPLSLTRPRRSRAS